jgi:hypothetical protein
MYFTIQTDFQKIKCQLKICVHATLFDYKMLAGKYLVSIICAHTSMLMFCVGTNDTKERIYVTVFYETLAKKGLKLRAYLFS